MPWRTLGLDATIIASRSVLGDLARDWDKHAPELDGRTGNGSCCNRSLFRTDRVCSATAAKPRSRRHNSSRSNRRGDCRRSPDHASRQTRRYPTRKTYAVFAALGIAKCLAYPSPRIEPAGDAIVAAAEQGNAIFRGAQCRAGEVLPLRGALAEPAVVGEVH